MVAAAACPPARALAPEARPDVCPASERGTIAPVRKLIKLALIALGIRALLRWWKSRQAVHAVPAADRTPDPADELRRKLAETRGDEAVEDAEVAAPPSASVAERRVAVPEQGRAALDEMKTSDEA